LVLRLLRQHLDTRGFQDIEISELGSAPYAKSSPKSAVARAAVEAADEVYGAPPVVYPLDPASGPVGAVCGASHPPTPVVSFGVSYYGSNPHAPDENIRLDDFLRGVKYFGRIIHRLAHVEEDEDAHRDAFVQLNK
jgi:acetylornithine deacetylase/succinyl-diaminopimelate desuccinylase-like protein